MLDQLLATGLVPDPLIKGGINYLLRDRIKSEKKKYAKTNEKEIIEQLSKGPIAIETDLANKQHYEVPTEFYQLVLGPRLKYSSCFFTDGNKDDLSKAEVDMLLKTCENAQIKDGMEVLDLGCGWGSLSFFLAEKYPQAKITAISNSKIQADFFAKEIERKNLKNLRHVKANINDVEFDQKFDRIVSIEMFEHVRNHRKLLNKVKSWLNPQGLLYVHIFVHKEMTYLFDVVDVSDWMSAYFFSGGMMPSDRYLYQFTDQFKVEEHWKFNGTHYQKTALAWLRNMDTHKQQILSIFKNVYGKEAKKWFHYWRVFFLSCAGLWGYKQGEEWFVSHYLLKPHDN